MVKGLFKYIRNCPTGVRPEPLILSTETKRKSRDPTAAKAILVCDFIAIVFWLLDIVHDAKSPRRDILHCMVLISRNTPQGSSDLWKCCVTLTSVEPVFFWDGPRGSDNAYRMKLSTWEKRTKDSLEVILSHSLITKYDAKTEVKFGKKIKRPLLVTELVMTLQEAKVELITCKGEADNLMAEYMRVHGNVCGILTNDTDMMLMHGVTAIHYKLFDQRGALRLSDDEVSEDYKVAEVHCGAISPGYLAKRLKINEKCLPAFSILCGNDFTGNLNDEINIKKLVFGYKHYVRIIAAIMPAASSNSVSRDSNDESQDSTEEEYDDTTAIPFCIKDIASGSNESVGDVKVNSSNALDNNECSDDDDEVFAKPPNINTAYSIDKKAGSIDEADSIDDEENEVSLPDSFFHQSDSDSTVSSDESHNTVSPAIYELVVLEVSSLRLDRKCLPVVKNGILWRDEIEQLDDELPCVYDVLQPVPMIIYKLLCCESVTEFGQSKINEFIQKRIKVLSPCIFPDDLSTLREELSREQKISLLIEAFKEPYYIALLQPFAKFLKDIPPTSRVPDIGSLLACVCFIYSYRNKLIPEDYVTPILQAFFYCSLEKLPPRISARPGHVKNTR
uniref:XPG-I domain-containing protein n=1 Tax=Amphimedon queenslandica TaxID=400682 RepID=A0A1X7UDX3_AMPQE